MKFRFLAAIAAIGCALHSTCAFAQHSDVEFGYDSTSSPTAFIIEQDETTLDGIQFFESEFETPDPFDPTNFFTDDPGFATNDAEGLLVNQGDQAWLKFLDASVHSAFGVGYVNYYNPTTDTLQALHRVSVLDNSGGTADLVLSGGIIESGDNPQFLGTGDSGGDIHDHVTFDLLDDATAPFGAYGLLVQMQSDFNPVDGIFDLDSDPFWIIINHGMDEEDFESKALRAYGVIPEPSSLGLLALIGGAFLYRRRARSIPRRA